MVNALNATQCMNKFRDSLLPTGRAQFAEVSETKIQETNTKELENTF